MIVHSHIGGSKCVVQQLANWGRYVDARRDYRYPNSSFIEVVQQGQVIERVCVPDGEAPEKIIELVKEPQ